MFMKRWMLRVVMMAMVLGCGDAAVTSTATESELTQPFAGCDYTQAFGNASHTGNACPGIRGMRVVQTITQDPDADAENTFSGFLQIHASPPVVSQDWVVIPSKRGFVDGFDRSPERYSVQAWKWTPSVTATDARLLPAWTADTTWQPVDGIVGSFGSYTNGYVQQFAPALVNGSVYVPSRHGTLQRLNLRTGAVVSTINPFMSTPFDGDEFTIVNSALTADAAGNVWYTVVAFPLDGNRSAPPRGSWLVKVAANDSSRLVDWETTVVAAGAPARDSLCEYPFGTAGTPDPTGPDSKAPLFKCGPQRPAMNVPVAVGDDGRVILYGYANNSNAAFVAQVDGSTFRPLAGSDTRGLLRYGCGVRLANNFPNCTVLTRGGTVNVGVDPEYNDAVQWLGEDIMDNAVTIAPNGDVTVGSYDSGFSFEGVGGFDARGSALTFSKTGAPVAQNTAFAWEVTFGVERHLDGTFSYLGDRNLYSLFDLSVARYDSHFGLQSQGSIPLDTNPNAVAIDWLDAHVPFDFDGRYYGVNGQGRVVAFDATGRQVDAVDLLGTDGAPRSMETESNYWARDRMGRLYLSYAGSVYVIDGDGLDKTPQPRAVSARLLAAMAAKRAAGAVAPVPFVN
jgi:hypothetical protein